jgi:LacI family transcriptional regulator
MLRENGVRRALAEAGHPLADRFVVEGNYDPDTTAAAVARLLDRSQRPTAVFAANDVSAIATSAVAHEAGLRVPEDLSVVGVDNIPESAMTSPPLTTVEQPIREMGRQAVRLLIDLVSGQEPEQTQITLETRLVERGSTASRTPARRRATR